MKVNEGRESSQLPTKHYIESINQRTEEVTMKPKTYLDYLPEDGNFTEEDLWEAIALAEGSEYDLSDGDLADYL